MDYTEFDPKEMLRSQIMDTEAQHFRLEQVVIEEQERLDAMPKAKSKIAQAEQAELREAIEQDIEAAKSNLAVLEARHASLIAQRQELPDD